MIVDAHNDLLAEIVFRRREDQPFARYWLPGLQAGGVGLQVCPIYTDGGESALADAVQQAGAFHRALAECADSVLQVRSGADLDRLDGRIGLVLSMEGVDPFESDPALVDAFWALGVRMVGLTWNRRNAFADGLGVEEDRGLSPLGEALVDRLAELGAIIDLAHASPRTFAEVLARAPGATVLVSHAGCRGVFDTPRNLSDEQLHALAERDGVLGILGLPITVDPNEPTLDRLVDHFDYSVSVLGADRVGIGADFIRQVARALGQLDMPGGLLPPGMAADAAVEGFDGPADFPALVAALERRGYSGERLEGVLSGNMLRLFRRGLPAS